MPQITNLRLFFSTATHLSPLLKPSSLSSLSKLNPPLLRSRKPPLAYPFSCISSSNSSRNPRNDSRKPLNLTRKSASHSLERDKGLKMEGNGGAVAGFNKRRVEGKDKSDRPKDLKLKVRKLNPVNTICYVQVLGTGMDTQDTSPSVLLFFDKQRFIFNAGEGLQRFCTEHKIKLSKIDHIFLSRVCSETAGGLPGLLLTLAGMGDEGMSVNLWGPSEFKYLVDAMKSFIPNAAMVHSRCFGPSPRSDGASFQDLKKSDGRLILIDDEVVKISAILLRPNCTEADGLIPEPLQHSPKHKAESILRTGDISVVYICELPEIRGKFDPRKATALGLRAGPKYRELQEGKSVMSDNKQRMIHPSDVLGPSVPGPVVLLVDCPTLSHLQELLAVQSLTHYYADMPGTPHEASKTVNSVIHLSPSSVVNSIDYQKWMSKFGGAEHIMAGHEMKNIEVPILKSSARVAARLNYLCPQFFPAPGFWPVQQLKCSTTSSELGSVSKLCEATSAENLLKFHLRPYAHLGLDRSCVPARTSSPEIIDDLLLEIPEIVDAAQQVSKFWNGFINEKEDVASTEGEKKLREEPWLNGSSVPSCLDNITRDDAEIVLLGTGSSQPSKYRNVTSIFINLFSKGSLLLDCGEGTLGQLKRRYGIDGADDAVKGLRCIWISHIHADHHTGLARVLALRRDLLKGVPHEPLIVVGPPQLKRFLDAYERLENLDMQFLDCRHTTETSRITLGSSSYDIPNGNKVNQHVDSNLFAKGSQMQSYWKRPVDSGIALSILKNLQNVLENAGLETLISFPVVHCPQAFGVALKAADRVNSVGKKIPGWKIIYSGDTRPCPELIKASQGATVLIHEATFEDGLVDEAIARNHSTTKEAIEVGESAGVYRIILTHFSQRYPKIPVFDESHMHKTCIAFDMMSVNLADLHVLPRVLPYLKLLFKNEMIVDETDDIETVAAMAV